MVGIISVCASTITNSSPRRTTDHGSQWSGDDKWEQGTGEKLFWSPTQLGCEVNTKDGSIRIEDLCWVLDAERLCKSVTGREWDEIEQVPTLVKGSRSTSDWDLHRRNS